MSRQENLGGQFAGEFVVLRDAKELRGRDRELIMASALSAQSIFERVPEEERDPKPGETDAERNTRLNAWIAATPLSIEESLALMGLRRRCAGGPVGKLVLLRASPDHQHRRGPACGPVRCPSGTHRTGQPHGADGHDGLLAHA